MSNQKNTKEKDAVASAVNAIVMWLAERTGVYDKIFETSKNSVIAEISVIDRKLSGELVRRDVRLTSACAIERLKWVLMEGGDWEEIADVIEEQENKYEEAT